MSKIEAGGRVYDALLDRNGEPVELSRYDEDAGIRITFCFDNASNGAASDEVLRCLKKCYLKNYMA